MSDYVKWGLLAAILLIVIASISTLAAFGALDDIFVDGGAVAVITSAMATLGGYLASARRLLNNFVYAPAVTAMLVFSFGMWVVALVVRFATFVTRLIYK